jgi:hypothetical protein
MSRRRNASARHRLLGWLLSFVALLTLQGHAFSQSEPMVVGDARSVCSAAEALAGDRDGRDAGHRHDHGADCVCGLSAADAAPPMLAVPLIGLAPAAASAAIVDHGFVGSRFGDWPSGRPRAPPARV